MSPYDRLSIWDRQPNSMSWYDHLVGRKSPAEPFITPHMTVENEMKKPDVYKLEDLKASGYQQEWYSKLTSKDDKKPSQRPQKDTYQIPVDPALINETPMLLRQPPYFEYLFADAEFEPSPGDSENSITDLSFGKSSCHQDAPRNTSMDGHSCQKETLTCEIHDFTAPQSDSEFTMSSPSSNNKRLGSMPPLDTPNKSFDTYWTPSSPQYKVGSADSPGSPGRYYGPTTPEYLYAEPTPFLDASAFNQHTFYQAGVPVTPKTVIDDHLAAIGTGLETSYFEAEETQLQEDKQSYANFFGTGREARSPMSLIFLDAPQTSTVLPPNFDPSKALQHGRRPKLQPKSQKSKLSRNYLGLKIDIPATHTAESALEANSIEIVKVARKRSADDAAEHDTTDAKDDDVEYICTKKARIVIGDTSTEVEFEEVPPVIDLTGLPETPSPRQSCSDFFDHKGLAIAPKGYAGQFDGMIVDRHGIANFKYNFTDEELAKLKGNHSVEFGDGLHPNGVFSHSAFSIDPWYYTPDLSEEHVPSGHALTACMHYANNMTIAAAHPHVVKLRSRDEEILRREAHIECANARLEGVAVGYFRYYQGHLSLEEYNNAEMCVCWEPCDCTKMCTRFGDMKCPCAKHIVVHGD